MPRGFRDAAGRAHFEGHRERLRQRFLKGGADALPDYELLELVLFRVFPQLMKPYSFQVC